MPSGRADLIMEKGSDWYVLLTTNQVDGTPMNLTGWLARCQIRKTANVTSPVVAVPIATIDNPLDGEVVLTLTAAETSAIPTSGSNFTEPSRYIYDLEIYILEDVLDADGNPVLDVDGNPTTTEIATSKLLHGFISVIPEVPK